MQVRRARLTDRVGVPELPASAEGAHLGSVRRPLAGELGLGSYPAQPRVALVTRGHETGVSTCATYQMSGPSAMSAWIQPTGWP